MSGVTAKGERVAAQAAGPRQSAGHARRMDVLADTGVWVDHLRSGNADLVDLMARDAVLIHPFVLTELACGTPPAPRQRTLTDLARLRYSSESINAV